MNINYKEPQFELFPANSATLEDINKPKFLLATLTLSTENLVILVILAIMIGLFSFSIGVERGRVLAAQALDEKAAAAWSVGGRRLTAQTLNMPQVSKPVLASPMVKPVGNAGLIHSVKPAAAPVSNSFVSGNKWTVQVATYKNENYAQQEALGLKAKGYPTFIVKSKDFYLVCVGQFGSQAQAGSLFAKIQAKYQGSQVRRF
jgi:cell division septation protein DedD